MWSDLKEGSGVQRQLFIPDVLPHEKILPEKNGYLIKDLTDSPEMLPNLVREQSAGAPRSLPIFSVCGSLLTYFDDYDHPIRGKAATDSGNPTRRKQCSDNLSFQCNWSFPVNRWYRRPHIYLICCPSLIPWDPVMMIMPVRRIRQCWRAT